MGRKMMLYGSLSLLAVLFIGGFILILPALERKPAASLNSTSLVSRSDNPIISGRAQNVTSLQVEVRPMTPNNATQTDPQGAWSVRATVLDGQWSVYAAPKWGSAASLPSGSYEVVVRSDQSDRILASSTLRILAGQVSPDIGFDQRVEEIVPSFSLKDKASEISNATQLAYTSLIKRWFPKELPQPTTPDPNSFENISLQTISAEVPSEQGLPDPQVAAVSIKKVNSPPSCTMTVRPSIIAPGQSATVSWWSANANAVSIGQVGTVKTSGSITVSPAASTAYKGSFTGVGGATFCSVFVAVDSSHDPASSSSQDVGVDTSAPDPSCGLGHDLDIALVLDKSLSIDQKELAQMINAFSSFVDLFLPDHPTLFSVTDFATVARVQQPFTSDVRLIKQALQSSANRGSTNWEDGLLKAKGTFDPRSNVPDLIIFASDGNPNASSGGQGEKAALTAAISVADAIKARGTRIITLGIGNEVGNSALNSNNLRRISSDNAYYNASTFGELAVALQTVAYNLCASGSTLPEVPPPPPQISLTVTPTLVRVGSTVAVSWTGLHVRSCTVTGTNGDLWRSNAGGSEVSSPITGQTTYTLRCTGLDKTSVSKAVVVYIAPSYNEL